MLTTTPKTKDEEHKNMIIGFIKNMNISDYNTFETEYKFNYYGDRGYIDLLTVSNDVNEWIDIYEFKTAIIDVGDTIRQVKKYAKNIKRMFNSSTLSCSIVVYDTIPNLKHLYDNIEYYYTALYNDDFVNGINYQFIYTSEKLKPVHYISFMMHPIGWFVQSIMNNLNSIEHTKSKNYKEYCDLQSDCYIYLTKSGDRDEFDFPTHKETIDYYQNVVSKKLTSA